MRSWLKGETALKRAVARIDIPGLTSLSQTDLSRQSILYLLSNVTVTTGSTAGFTSKAEDIKDTLPTAEEQAAALEEQLDLSSYDPTTDPLLTDLPQMLTDMGVDPLVQANILAAVGKKQFPLSLQYEMTGNVEVRTLGQLADSRANEHAQQFIYPTSIKKILFGKFGIAKGKKLSSNIEVAYFRDRESGELGDMIISSGRHRVTAIIALLQHLGVAKWRDQKVMVICKVVNSDPEFAQLIETANDSRKMPRAEVQVHGLTKSGVRTSTSDAFYETRFNASKTQLGHCFGKAVQFELAGFPQVSQDAIVSMSGSAWNKLFNHSAENRATLSNVILGPDEEALKMLARKIAADAMSFVQQAPNEFPDDKVHVGSPKLCAREIAKLLSIECPAF